MTPMAQTFRDTDGEAERGGYPQISQMTQIPEDVLNNNEARLGRIRGVADVRTGHPVFPATATLSACSAVIEQSAFSTPSSHRKC
jgi:hypothetical protein